MSTETLETEAMAKTPHSSFGCSGSIDLDPLLGMCFISVLFGPVVVSQLSRCAETARSTYLVSHVISALAAATADYVSLLAASLSHRWSALCHPALPHGDM